MKKHRPHTWHKFRSIAWLVCLGCGLVWLRNDATERAVRRACPGDCDE